MYSVNNQDIIEILKLFENELNLLVRIDRLEKMEIRKKIKDAIMPISGINFSRSKIFMDILEDKLHDVFALFIDGYEFRKKLERKVAEILKDKQR